MDLFWDCKIRKKKCRVEFVGNFSLLLHPI